MTASEEVTRQTLNKILEISPLIRIDPDETNPRNFFCYNWQHPAGAAAEINEETVTFSRLSVPAPLAAQIMALITLPKWKQENPAR